MMTKMGHKSQLLMNLLDKQCSFCPISDVKFMQNRVDMNSDVARRDKKVVVIGENWNGGPFYQIPTQAILH